MGSKPAIIFSGPGKGKQIFKVETAPGLAILNSLDATQIEKTVINKTALGEILTAASGKAMINDPKGILYSELNPAQKKFFMQLLPYLYTSLYPFICIRHDAGDRSSRIK